MLARMASAHARAVSMTRRNASRSARVEAIREGMKIAHLAHVFGVGVQAHNCGSPLATAIPLQF